jgi:prevent-host-death family protein
MKSARRSSADTVNLYEAKTNLSELVDRAAAGEEIVIAKAGKPKAKLVPYRIGKKAAVDRIFWESHTLRRTSMLGCRPKYRSILSRQREDLNRYAYLYYGGISS